VAVIAFALVGIAVGQPARSGELIVAPGVIASQVIARRVIAPGIVRPGYAFPRARQPAPGTDRALDGVRNGTNREERDRHGGPEIDLSGRPVLTGRFREFQN
jgi:hypothetical protein